MSFFQETTVDRRRPLELSAAVAALPFGHSPDRPNRFR
jgi:hypothetical protein